MFCFLNIIFLETSPTLGSLSTSDAEKRSLARRSREFNLKHKLFCKLFPELARSLRDETEQERVAALAMGNSVEINNTRSTVSKK